MKNTQILRYALFPSTLAVPALFPSHAHAQARMTPAVARIPFDFRVGNAHLKAGRYNVQQPLGFIVAFRTSHQAGNSVVFPSLGTEPSPSSRLVFHRYGDVYFLHEIWTMGSTDHLTVPVSKEEKKVQQEILRASTSLQTGNVELALLEATH